MLKHAKISSKGDGADPSLVQPSDWNADHVFTGDVTLPANLIVTLDITSRTISTRYDIDGPAANYAMNYSVGVNARSGWLAYNNVSYGGVIHYGPNYAFVTGGAGLANRTVLTGNGAGGLAFESAAPQEWWTNSAKRMTLDNNGNLGIGVTPKAWVANYRTLSIGPQGSIFAVDYAGQTNTALQLTNNAFFDGSTWRAVISMPSALYGLQDGAFVWYNNSAGTPAAGAPFNFAERMRLTAAGALCINAAAPIGAELFYCAGPMRAASLTTSAGISSGNNIGWPGGNLIADTGGGSSLNVNGFGITNTFDIRGFGNNDYVEVHASGNVVRLAAPGGGGGNWTVVSERAKKKDLAPLPGDVFAMINGHSVEVGRYITDPADAPLHAYLFFEDAIVHYPYATSHMAERTLRNAKTGTEMIDPEYNGLSQEAYVPLLMRAMQLVDQRLKAGGL